MGYCDTRNVPDYGGTSGFLIPNSNFIPIGTNVTLIYQYFDALVRTNETSVYPHDDTSMYSGEPVIVTCDGSPLPFSRTIFLGGYSIYHSV